MDWEPVGGIGASRLLTIIAHCKKGFLAAVSAAGGGKPFSWCGGGEVIPIDSSRVESGLNKHKP